MRSRTLRRLATPGACLALAVALLVGCGGGDAADRAPTSGGADASLPESSEVAESMTVNVAVAPATLDPGNQCNVGDAISMNLYSRLVQFGTREGPGGIPQTDQTKIEPDLASSWDVSPDGRTYTFHLRDDARFSSGRPVDAEAIVYTFERVQSMGLCSAYGVNASDTGNVTSIEAVDPHTVRIEMREPNSALIKSWATSTLGIVDPGAVEEHGGVEEGKPSEHLSTNSAGSGPYVLEEYRPNERAVLVANPDYYGEAPKTKRITVNFIQSDSTLLLQARNGTADVTLGLSKQAINSLEDEPGLRIVASEGTNTEQVILNWDKEPFDDVRVREAVALAVPYGDLVERVAYGYGRLFNGPILPSMPFYDGELAGEPSTDLERARALMQEATGGERVRVTMIIIQGNAVQEQLATLLQDTWRQIGIDLAVRKLDAAAYTGALFGNQAQAAIRHDGPFVNDPDYYLGYDMQCAAEGTENTGNVCIPDADVQLETARRALDDETKQEAYSEVTRLWGPQWPKIFLYLDQDVAVLSDKVTGFRIDPTPVGFAEYAKQP